MLRPRGIVTNLSPPVLAALLMIAASAVFSMMNGIIRHLSTEIDPLAIVFFRNLFGMLAMTPWLVRYGFGGMRTKRIGLISLRSFIGFLAMATWFSALAIVPLDNAVALSFTAPLFATVFAVLILHEVIRARRITALAIGFAGTMVILQPGMKVVTFGEVLVILSAVAMALSIVIMKKLTATESSGSLVIYQTMLVTPISLVPAIFVWTWPSAEMWGWIIVLGILASTAHMMFTRAFALAEATYLMPFDYVKLPMVAVIAYVFFGESPSAWTFVGAAIIAASTVYVAHREARVRAERRTAAIAGASVGDPQASPGRPREDA